MAKGWLVIRGLGLLLLIALVIGVTVEAEETLRIEGDDELQQARVEYGWTGLGTESDPISITQTDTPGISRLELRNLDLRIRIQNWSMMPASIFVEGTPNVSLVNVGMGDQNDDLTDPGFGSTVTLINSPGFTIQELRTVTLWSTGLQVIDSPHGTVTDSRFYRDGSNHLEALVVSGSDWVRFDSIELNGGSGTGIACSDSMNLTISRSNFLWPGVTPVLRTAGCGGGALIDNDFDGYSTPLTPMIEIADDGWLLLRNNFTDAVTFVSLNGTGSRIFLNNFDSSLHPVDSVPGNLWDLGYPCGGNYWHGDDHVDTHQGPEQDVPGKDWIDDEPYLDGDIFDRYPFTYPVHRDSLPRLNSEGGPCTSLVWDEVIQASLIRLSAESDLGDQGGADGSWEVITEEDSDLLIPDRDALVIQVSGSADRPTSDYEVIVTSQQTGRQVPTANLGISADPPADLNIFWVALSAVPTGYWDVTVDATDVGAGSWTLNFSATAPGFQPDHTLELFTYTPESDGFLAVVWLPLILVAALVATIVLSSRHARKV